MASRNINPLMLAGANLKRNCQLATGIVAAWNQNVFPATQILYDGARLANGTCGMDVVLAADPVHGYVTNHVGSAQSMIHVPASPWNMTTPFTITGWFRKAVGDNLLNRHIWWERGSGAGGTELIGQIGAQEVSPYQKLFVQMRPAEGGAFRSFPTASDLMDNLWHFFAAVCDFSGATWIVTWYIDGRYDAAPTAAPLAGTWSFDNKATIGGRVLGTTTGVMVGYTSAMMPFSRALSAAEIASLYADPYQIWDAGEDEMEWAKAAAAAAGNPYWYYNMLKQRRRAC